MKNLLVVLRDTLDQIIIADMVHAKMNLDENSGHYGRDYFITGDCSDYVGIHVDEIDNEAEAARIISEWATVSRNQTFVHPDVTAFEICTDETRYRVTRDMPDWIVCYVDYIDPLKDREPQPAPVEYQYINRRETMPDGTRGDGALWPTFCPITSPGWVQIGAVVTHCRNDKGNTVLVYDGFPKPFGSMHVGGVVDVRGDGFVMLPGGDVRHQSVCINFTKGDHLSADEREAWHQEATGHQESYYESFNRNQ